MFYKNLVHELRFKKFVNGNNYKMHGDYLAAIYLVSANDETWKLPTVKSLQVEFAELLTTKKEAYAELKKVRDELRDVAVHTANYEELRDLAEREPRKEKEHGRE